MNQNVCETKSCAFPFGWFGSFSIEVHRSMGADTERGDAEMQSMKTPRWGGQQRGAVRFSLWRRQFTGSLRSCTCSFHLQTSFWFLNFNFCETAFVQCQLFCSESRDFPWLLRISYLKQLPVRCHFKTILNLFGVKKSRRTWASLGYKRREGAGNRTSYAPLEFVSWNEIIGEEEESSFSPSAAFGNAAFGCTAFGCNRLH